MPRLSKNSKPIILKNGTLIVSTTPHIYDNVQPLWGYTKSKHEDFQLLKYKALTMGSPQEMLIYFDTNRPYDDSKDPGIQWLITNSFRIIPKYAIPGFIAMQKRNSVKDR